MVWVFLLAGCGGVDGPSTPSPGVDGLSIPSPSAQIPGATLSPIPTRHTLTPTSLYTLSPTRAPTHTPFIFWTRAPTSTPTVTLTLTPSPTLPPLPEIDVTCYQFTVSYFKCYDALLKIDFQYPVTWGEIQTEISRGEGERGVAYGYWFLEQPADLFESGGRSHDWASTAGSGSEDFWFAGLQMPFDEFCQWGDAHGTTLCTQYHPGVATVIILPDAEERCDLEPDFSWEPQFWIVIDLPENETVQGFIFMSRFFSDALWEEIEQSWGVADESARCDSPEARQAYDDKMAEVAERIQSDTLDWDTQYRVNLLRYMAEAIILH